MDCRLFLSHPVGSVLGVEEALATLDEAMDRCLSVALFARSSEERRLITGAMRRALIVRDKGCAFPDCGRPPRWCHAHHVIHWLNGGKTCVENGVLLCPHHHRVIHHGEWQVHINEEGHPVFTQPPDG